MSRRIEYLDFLKFFAIFSVLLGHSTEQMSANLFWDHPLWEFIYSYHMPLFMFLCGFFFRSSLKKPFGQMTAVKLRQLGVPSLTAFAIDCLLLFCLGTTAIADLCEFSFAGFINSVWFLKCVLFCYLIMYPMCKLVRNDIAASLTASALITLIPGCDIVNLNFMLPMFCLGMVCGNHLDSIEKHRRWLLLLSVVLFSVLLCFWSGRLTVYMVPTKTIDFASGSVDWHNLLITLYRLAIGMAGTMTFFLLARPVYGWLSKFSFAQTLCRIGGATLGIYFLQTFLLEILVNRLCVYLPLPWSYAAALLLAVLELAVCYNLVRLIRKSGVASLLILGEIRTMGE
ncbi:MAG: acyltransferase family protein [Alistipes sp.]|nr:acyltransferase family protein [Candidatus Minthomonas equi]